MGRLAAKYRVGAFLVALLSLIGFVLCIVRFNKGPAVSMITYIVMYVLIFVYAFWGYKKPHGNMLKYLFFIYSISLVAGLVSCVQYGDVTNAVFTAVCIALIAYMSGRLHRIRENRLLMVLVFIILSCEYIRAFIYLNNGIISVFSIVSPVIMWMDLCSAYFLRYSQHKLAGLTENTLNKEE